MLKQSCVLQAFSIASLLAIPGQSVLKAQSLGTIERIRLLVSQNATNELSLSSVTQDAVVDPAGLRIERGPHLSNEFTVWRIGASDQVFLLVHAGDSVFRAGGFQQQDLGAIAKIVTSGSGCRSNQDKVKCLALLADPFGAVEIVLPGVDSTTRPGVMAAWDLARPGDWPFDHPLDNSDKGATAVITVLTRNLGGFERSWVAMAYALTFSHGELVAWSHRESPPFAP